MPEVSVVIPVYNHGDTVERAIDSALAQTLRDIEVIVVDDASTDDTQTVLDRIGDPRVTCLRHDSNRGGSAARNTGIDHATGEYIALLDADDEWRPQKLEQQCAELRSRSAEWVGAYCDFRQTRSNRLVELVDNAVRRPTGLEGDDVLINGILLRRFAHGGSSTLFVERAAVEAIDGFDASFQRHQDLEFLLRLLQRGKLAFVDETLVYKHDSGYPDAETVREAHERFTETFADLIAERGYDERIERLQRFHWSKQQFREGRFREGLRSLRGSECPHHRDALGLGFAFLTGLQRCLG
jgi:glycosyltransferase involved in cell wall biosynthesis